jgi:hypothetical protein
MSLIIIFSSIDVITWILTGVGDHFTVAVFKCSDGRDLVVGVGVVRHGRVRLAVGWIVATRYKLPELEAVGVPVTTTSFLNSHLMVLLVNQGFWPVVLNI